MYKYSYIKQILYRAENGGIDVTKLVRLPDNLKAFFYDGLNNAIYIDGQEHCPDRVEFKSQFKRREFVLVRHDKHTLLYAPCDEDELQVDQLEGYVSKWIIPRLQDFLSSKHYINPVNKHER